MAVGLLVLIGGFFLVKDQAWVQRIGFLQRLATISLEDATTKARFINWSMAWKGVQEKPILGWGQENYALVFDKYYDPRMHSQEPWFDRVHNIIFDWWVAGGTLGLIAYLSIFLAALYALWFSRGFTIAERSILTGLLAGYFVHNFFVFDNVTSYILFGTVLAFLAYRADKAREARALWSGEIRRAYVPYVALLCVLALLFVAWGVNQRPLAANRLLLQAIAPQGQPSSNLEYMRQSIALGTFGMQEAREQLAQMAAQASQLSLPSETKRQFFELAESEMRKQEEMSPLDARFPLFLGVLYSAYGLHNEAKAAYERALEDSPRKQAIMFQLAENAIARGENAAALAFYKQAHELEKSFATAAVLYASGLILNGQTAQGEEVLAPYIETGQAADPRVLAAYRSTDQLARAVPIWQAAIRANPQDAQLYFTLAAIHYLSGNRAAAIAALEEAKRAIPGIAEQADPVIEEIRSGTAEVL
jgi:tetratricopeptide (TPR) repeat protein